MQQWIEVQPSLDFVHSYQGMSFGLRYSYSQNGITKNQDRIFPLINTDTYRLAPIGTTSAFICREERVRNDQNVM
jgi:hypothetical protein